MITTDDKRPQSTSDQSGEGGAPPARNDATAQPAIAGCRLQDLADAKGLPADLLIAQGWSDMHYCSRPAVRIPYRDTRGEETSVRIRVGLNHDGERFRWKTGDKPCLYGFHELATYDRSVALYLVEGETDVETMRLQGHQALGVPGANTWRPEWAEYIEDFQTIYLVAEPDAGGAALTKCLAESSLVG